MSDPSSILWPAEPHTLAKHAILEEYAKAWTAILSHQSGKHPGRKEELLFVDGFAGPGAYKDREPGSPILAVKLLVEHTRDFPTPVRLLFIEKDTHRCEHLKHLLKQWDKRIRACQRISRIDVVCEDCARVLHGEIDRVEEQGGRLGPAFFFLDQFGWSHVPLNLIARIMTHPVCEVLSYLNWNRLNQFMPDTAKWSTISAVFGGKEWQPAVRLPQQERRGFMLNAYKSALHSRAGAKFVLDFAMRDAHGHLIYWLFFCTNSLRGLEVMKTAMWKIDRSGGLCFSDNDDPAQLRLLAEYDSHALARELARVLAGRTMTIAQVHEHVLVRTPAHAHKPALKELELQGCLEVVDPPTKRRKGTFANERMRVRFTGKLP